MSRGNVQSIPTGTQTLQRTLNAEVRATIRVLNPNDGIVYVAINGQASPVTFDFVVPSQSYAALPGPWMEYGLYFLDQSGAGRTGVVTVYESDERLDFPDYHAIGRSLQAQVTTLDITQGVLPPAPPVGITRIWSDSNGDIAALLSTGAVAPFFTNPPTFSTELSTSLNLAIASNLYNVLVTPALAANSKWIISWKAHLNSGNADGPIMGVEIITNLGVVLDVGRATPRVNHGGGGGEVQVFGRFIYTAGAAGTDNIQMDASTDFIGTASVPAIIGASGIISGHGNAIVTYIRGTRIG